MLTADLYERDHRRASMAFTAIRFLETFSRTKSIKLKKIIKKKKILKPEI